MLAVLTVCTSVFAAGCTGKSSTSNQGYSGTQVEETMPAEHFKINSESSIPDDFEYFNLKLNEAPAELPLSDLTMIFPDDSVFYLYFSMPEDNDQHAYRVQKIRINEMDYQPVLLSMVSGTQKYKIPECRVADDGKYSVDGIIYSDEKRPDDTYNATSTQTITMSLTDGVFSFDQQHQYKITLAGTQFESIYQFNKNNVLYDLWNNAINSVKGLDKDRRSFFYFAFNCYDTERDIHFVPDTIKELTVDYTSQTYTYQGKDKPDDSDYTLAEKTTEETIIPEQKVIIAKSQGKSNKLPYIYDTINKLTKADLTQNVGGTNKTVLEYAARSYDWAVVFGDPSGYPIKDNHTWYGKYDVGFTKMKDFETIHVVYEYKGQTVSTNTDSLVLNGTQSATEDYHHPDTNETILNNNAVQEAEDAETEQYGTFWDKLLLSMKNKAILFTTVGVIAILIYCFLSGKFRKLIKLIRKQIEEFRKDHDHREE